MPKLEERLDGIVIESVLEYREFIDSAIEVSDG